VDIPVLPRPILQEPAEKKRLYGVHSLKSTIIKTINVLQKKGYEEEPGAVKANI